MKMLKKQQGAALFVGLMILTILTLVVISGAQSTILQEKMAGNVRQSNEAFQLSEDINRDVSGRLGIAQQTGTTGGLEVISWADANLPLLDCGVKAILSDPDMDASTWSTAPVTMTDRETTYRLIEMSVADSADGEAITCYELSESASVGAAQGNYFALISNADSPSKKTDSTVLTILFYPN